MDSAQHCLDQSAECRRLMKSAQSEAETYALKNLSRSWVGLAGQIDRYNALVRGRRRTAAKFAPDSRSRGHDSASSAGIDLDLAIDNRG